MVKRSPGHWTQRLFVEKPYLYLPFLEKRKKEGVKDAGALARLFRRHGIRAGSRILDLCCGIGRISVPLARYGYYLVGVDISPEYIKKARLYATAKRVARRTKFVVGDYQDISSAISDEEPFRGIVSAFTSVGYYGRDADKKAFNAIAERTAKGGIFVIEAVNRDWIVRHFEAKGYEMAGSVLVLVDRKFDAERSYMVNRWEYLRIVGPHIRPEGIFRVTHRMYGPADLKDLLTSTGWAVISASSDYDGNPLDITAVNKPHMVTVAKKR